MKPQIYSWHLTYVMRVSLTALLFGIPDEAKISDLWSTTPEVGATLQVNGCV